MGAFLDTPITKKDSDSGSGNSLSFGVSSMQGWRSTMEDAHCAAAEIKSLPGCSFFAVFDGHAGSFMAKKCATLVLQRVEEALTAKPEAILDPAAISTVLRTCFLSVDHELRDQCKDGSGTTAVAAFLSPTHIVVANCGDSRCVLSRVGHVWSSIDHKPALDAERTRIMNAGGFVAMNRVDGCLAVSRALGDYEFKRRLDIQPEHQKVSGEPECTVLERLPGDEFLVLCCDGVWDVLTSEDCVGWIRSKPADMPPALVVESLLDKCLELGSRDNMTACLIKLDGASPASAPATAPAPAEAADVPVGGAGGPASSVEEPAPAPAPAPAAGDLPTGAEPPTAAGPETES